MTLKNPLSLILMIALISGCSSQMTKKDYEMCVAGSSAVGGAVGVAVGNGPGAVAGMAGGAVMGLLFCDQQTEAPAQPAAPVDSDGDGVPDNSDACPGTPRGVPVDSRGCPRDDDQDGVPNYLDECPATPRGVKVDSKGCPEKGEVLIRIENINFEFNSAQLDSTSRARLDEAAGLIKQSGRINLEIVGHTDSTGSNSYNQSLSERRAMAVRDYLVTQGVNASSLSTTGRGEDAPIAPNDTDANRARNRRVEFIVK